MADKNIRSAFALAQRTIETVAENFKPGDVALLLYRVAIFHEDFTFRPGRKLSPTARALLAYLRGLEAQEQRENRNG